MRREGRVCVWLIKHSLKHLQLDDVFMGDSSWEGESHIGIPDFLLLSFRMVSHFTLRMFVLSCGCVKKEEQKSRLFAHRVISLEKTFYSLRVIKLYKLLVQQERGNFRVWMECASQLSLLLDGWRLFFISIFGLGLLSLLFPRICFLHFTVISTLHATRHRHNHRLSQVVAALVDYQRQWSLRHLAVMQRGAMKVVKCRLHEDFKTFFFYDPCFPLLNICPSLLNLTLFYVTSRESCCKKMTTFSLTYDLLLSILFFITLSIWSSQLHTDTGLQRVYYPRHEPP